MSPGHSQRELARKWPNDVSQQRGRRSGRQSRFKCKCANEIKATQPKPVGKPSTFPLSYFSALPHGPTVQHVDRVKCLVRNCCGLQHILLCSAPCTAATAANCPCRNARNYKVSKSLDHKSISHFWLSEQFMASQRRFRYQSLFVPQNLWLSIVVNKLSINFMKVCFNLHFAKDLLNLLFNRSFEELSQMKRKQHKNFNLS